jgi:hypothetical protein
MHNIYKAQVIKVSYYIAKKKHGQRSSDRNAGTVPATSDVGNGDGKCAFAVTMTNIIITSTTSATKRYLLLRGVNF